MRYAGLEEEIKTYKECKKKDKCQLSQSNDYLCDNIRACTYIHYYENKIKEMKSEFGG